MGNIFVSASLGYPFAIIFLVRDNTRNNTVRILLAEDDQMLSKGIHLALSQNGYLVDQVRTGLDADNALTVTPYDLVILDLGLPELDGLEVLTRLRQRGQPTPVVILTARDGVKDRITGLDLGANDYMTKPFHLDELEARIRALLRKGNWSNRTEIKYNDFVYDTVGRRLTVHGQPVDLSAREVAVLELLLQKAGKVVNKQQITEHLSSWETSISFNAIEIIVHRLRKKLEGSGINVRTIRGLGYILEPPQSGETIEPHRGEQQHELVAPQHQLQGQ
ncbi:MAG: response regulator transcription factor [Candidatus Obscuribacterales bacterium]|nr:response regulator transcription factor [Candidatus Obscuribacterales bacterium]